MRIALSILFLSLFFFSCEKTVLLDLEQTPVRIVIEAQVTNQWGYQFVKVTRSADFYTSGKTPRVQDALVTVTDDEGLVISFIHNPRNHADSMGYYLPATPFRGTLGKSYSLFVNVDGKEFQASDKLLPVIPVDSLQYRENEFEKIDPKEKGKFYEILMFAREPQDQKNYYLFKFFRNDSLTLYNETDIYYSDDELLAEKIDGVPSPVYYAKGDRADLEIYSLSRAGYVYYNDLFTILNNDGGGMFGPIPASPRTNLSGGALGFFQVSAVHKSGLNIE